MKLADRIRELQRKARFCQRENLIEMADDYERMAETLQLFRDFRHSESAILLNADVCKLWEVTP